MTAYRLTVMAADYDGYVSARQWINESVPTSDDLIDTEGLGFVALIETSLTSESIKKALEAVAGVGYSLEPLERKPHEQLQAAE